MLIYVGIVVAIATIDLCIKKRVDEDRELHHKQDILNGHIVIQKVYNDGAFLHLGEDKKEYVLAGSSTAFGFITATFARLLGQKGKKAERTGYAFLLGGATGNLLDRIFHGHVIDYFSFPRIRKIKNMVFNLSDIFIFLGLLMISFCKKDEK